MVKEDYDCQGGGGWLGKQDLQTCADSCKKSPKFVHATNGDKNCKCLKGKKCKPRNLENAKRDGLVLYKNKGKALKKLPVNFG